jgi:hypothetical protein
MPKEDEVVDFSNFQSRTQAQTPLAPPPSPITYSAPKTISLKMTRRTKVMIGIVVALILIQIFIFYYRQPPKSVVNPSAPQTQTK